MVVDTSAVLAVVFEEPESAVFAELLATSSLTLISAVSWLEAGIVVEARKGRGAVRDYRALLAAARIKTVDFTIEQAQVAMEAWQRYGRGRRRAALNLGDCCAYALSKTTGRPLLFKGTDFSRTDIAAVRY